MLVPESRSAVRTSIDNDRIPSGAPAMAFMSAKSPVVRFMISPTTVEPIANSVSGVCVTVLKNAFSVSVAERPL